MSSPEQIAARIAAWDTDGPQGPVTLELYPTLSCNLNCQFCDTTDRHRPPVNELSEARLLSIVDEAADLGVQRLFLLGGGEPLLRKQATPAVMARAKFHGMEGILTTNGTLLSPKLCEQFIAMGWDEIHFSIDGPNAEIHDKLRGQAGAFKKTVRNACRLSVLKKRAQQETPRIALHFVLTNQNHHTLTEMVELAAAVGAFRVDFDALIAYTPEQQALALSDTQRNQVAKDAREAMNRATVLGIATTLENFLHPERIDRGATPPPLPDGEGLKGAPCLKAWHHLVVAADGKTSPCCVLAGSGGSVADEAVDTVWHSDPFMNTVRKGMLAQTPTPRCSECSWNILAHEAEIRSHL
jgi:MoaA/NifB/PqqE/SkfB family radical SAM enzyme